MSFLFVAVISVVGFTQDKNEKNCCADTKSEKTIGKMCDFPEDVSVSANDESESLASIKSDDKVKKSEKNTKKMDKSVKQDKSKNKSSEEGCCSPSTKKTEKSKSSSKS